MTPWHDCAPSHSQPDGAVVAGSTHRATHRPRQLAPSQSARGASCLPPTNSARHGHRGPPSSGLCGHLTPPSSPSIGIWPGPFAFPYPSSLVSTTGTSRFGGFGLNLRPVFRWFPNVGLALVAFSILVVGYLHATGVYRFDWSYAFYALGIMYFVVGIVINVDYLHLLCVRIFVQPSNDVKALEPDRSSPSSLKPPFS